MLFVCTGHFNILLDYRFYKEAGEKKRQPFFVLN